MTAVSGVYAIARTNGKGLYIGSSVNIRNRFRKHKTMLRINRHINPHLQNAWNKYGEDCFTFTLLMECSPDQCIEFEQKMITLWDPDYNICSMARSVLGITRSARTRAKISAANKGRKHSKETRAKISKIKTNPSNELRAKLSAAQKRRKPPSDVTRARISAAGKGHKCSDETRAKIGAANALRWANLDSKTRAKHIAGKTGLKRSDQAKANMSAAQKGRPGYTPSDEIRAKISASLMGHKGHKHSDEERAKISTTLKGHKRSDKTKAKMSAAALRRHAKARREKDR